MRQKYLKDSTLNKMIRICDRSVRMPTLTLGYLWCNLGYLDTFGSFGYFWCTFAVLLGNLWCTFGVPLGYLCRYLWGTLGVPLGYLWILLAQLGRNAERNIISCQARVQILKSIRWNAKWHEISCPAHGPHSQEHSAKCAVA